jgi:tetratricopeptide (TPR) repeat protein
VLVKGDTLEGMRLLKKVTNATALFTEGYAQRFRLDILQNNWADVEQNISRAIGSSRADAHVENHSYLLTLQAIIYAREKREQEAMEIFNEAIKTDRKNHLAYLERGKLFRQLGKTTKAQNDFKEASVLGNPEAAKIIAN